MSYRFKLFRLLWPVLFALAGVFFACIPEPAPAARDCLSDQDCTADQRCNDWGYCEARLGCGDDTDCLADEHCDQLDGLCKLRSFFARDCQQDGQCDPGYFCALGRCRDSAHALQCADAYDCPSGYRCDRQHFYCIEDVPCVLAADFPETACDPGQSCDDSSQTCLNTAQPECSSANQAINCAADELCDSSGRCVQCSVDADCGPGLRCNSRAGRCESVDLCHSDDDCNPPLVCDPFVALCRVPLPPCDSDLDCALAEFCNHVSGRCQPVQGQCIDDRLEENDSPAGPSRIDLSQGEIALNDLQLCPDDDDVFAFALDAGQGLDLQFELAETALTTVELYAYAPDGVSLLDMAYAPPRGNGHMSFNAAQAGTYFVRLVARTAPVSYAVRFALTQQQPCIDDQFEAGQGNDSATLAASITPGHYENLSLCFSDEDFYRITLLAGSSLDLDVQGQAGLDPDLQLYDMASGTLLHQAISAGERETLRYHAVADGQYILRVKAYGLARGVYSMDLGITAPWTCTADSFDLISANDSLEQATSLTELDGENLSLCTGDRDCFVVELENYQRLSARAVYAPEDVALRLRAYQQIDAADVVSSTLGLGVETVHLNAPASLADGDLAPLWLCVDSLDGSSGPYSLDLHVMAQTQCLPDADEPNENPAQASDAVNVQTAASGAFSLCGMDQDYYRVHLSAGKVLAASLTFSIADGDLDLQLIHSDAQTVLQSSDGVAESEHIRWRAELDGDYFLRVYSQDQVQADYLLGVIVEE